MTQTNFIDHLESKKNQAIYAVGAFAEPEWKTEARAVVNMLTLRGNPFSTDMVWSLLNARDITTPEPRAMGAVIREFTKAKKIKLYGYEPSTQPKNHRRPVSVWVKA